MFPPSGDLSRHVPDSRSIGTRLETRSSTDRIGQRYSTPDVARLVRRGSVMGGRFPPSRGSEIQCQRRNDQRHGENRNFGGTAGGDNAGPGGDEACESWSADQHGRQDERDLSGAPSENGTYPADISEPATWSILDPFLKDVTGEPYGQLELSAKESKLNRSVTRSSSEGIRQTHLLQFACRRPVRRPIQPITTSGIHIAYGVEDISSDRAPRRIIGQLGQREHELAREQLDRDIDRNGVAPLEIASRREGVHCRQVPDIIYGSMQGGSGSLSNRPPV
ncbi:hypothetical protein K469DRAFT_691173 [Zopfia rhizophila CBS 207.26]|uniref:Uncharacterized protein n=1 Tax=Zopfia rhizophila CBS 207.26 TaxID=1314779 RepID=A0A6A6ER57_9PEZI|nr:hypothetical protein K469DRAFT_691173 [Zopfia rhizophila CBS 207.26]